MRDDGLASVGGLITALALQDVEAALAYFAYDAEYILAGGVGLFGTRAYQGKGELRVMLRHARARWLVLASEPDVLLERHEEVRAAITYELQHRETGQVLVDRRRYVMQMSGRLVQCCVETLDSARLRAFLEFAHWRG